MSYRHKSHVILTSQDLIGHRNPITLFCRQTGLNPGSNLLFVKLFTSVLKNQLRSYCIPILRFLIFLYYFSENHSFVFLVYVRGQTSFHNGRAIRQLLRLQIISQFSRLIARSSDHPPLPHTIGRALRLAHRQYPFGIG